MAMPGGSSAPGRTTTCSASSSAWGCSPLAWPRIQRPRGDAAAGAHRGVSAVAYCRPAGVAHSPASIGSGSSASDTGSRAPGRTRSPCAPSACPRVTHLNTNDHASSGAGRERHVLPSLLDQQVTEIGKHLITLLPHRTRHRATHTDEDDEIVVPDTAAHQNHHGAEPLVIGTRAIQRLVPPDPPTLIPPSVDLPHRRLRNEPLPHVAARFIPTYSRLHVGIHFQRDRSGGPGRTQLGEEPLIPPQADNHAVSSPALAVFDRVTARVSHVHHAKLGTDRLGRRLGAQA